MPLMLRLSLRTPEEAGFVRFRQSSGLRSQERLNLSDKQNASHARFPVARNVTDYPVSASTKKGC